MGRVAHGWPGLTCAPGLGSVGGPTGPAAKCPRKLRSGLAALWALILPPCRPRWPTGAPALPGSASVPPQVGGGRAWPRPCTPPSGPDRWVSARAPVCCPQQRALPCTSGAWGAWERGHRRVPGLLGRRQVAFCLPLTLNCSPCGCGTHQHLPWGAPTAQPPLSPSGARRSSRWWGGSWAGRAGTARGPGRRAGLAYASLPPASAQTLLPRCPLSSPPAATPPEVPCPEDTLDRPDPTGSWGGAGGDPTLGPAPVPSAW